MAWNALPPLIVRAAAPLPRLVAARAVATAPPTMAANDATFEHRPDQRRFVLTTDGKVPASLAQSNYETRAAANG